MHPTTADTTDTTVGREKPIIFSGESVRAILAGRKTQTRRVVKIQPVFNFSDPRMAYGGIVPKSPYRVGDRLWVREGFRVRMTDSKGTLKADYKADADGTVYMTWKPPIHMPRWASRLTLEVTAVRVERLQEISEADVLAEGCEYFDPPAHPFSEAWDAINGKAYPWESNPWVWVIEFKPVTPPVPGGCER